MKNDDERHARIERIWRAVADIPPGRVASYGQISRMAGVPRGARLVGYALRTAPDELDLPWHRVINAAGRISLPAGSDAAKKQARRLRAEGVRVYRGCVDMRAFRWEPDLDELLWRPRD